MRLICPRCGAQYDIADDLIPPAGREVECSACAHVWHQGKPRPMPAAVEGDTGAPPLLHRPLSESILSVLREEADRELRARAFEEQALETPPAPQAPRADARPDQGPGAGGGAADGLQPARDDSQPARGAQDQERASPAPPGPLSETPSATVPKAAGPHPVPAMPTALPPTVPPALTVPDVQAGAAAAESDVSAPAAPAPQSPAPAAQVAPPLPPATPHGPAPARHSVAPIPARRRYDAGFAFGTGLIAALLAAYLAAPSFGPQGQALRAQADAQRARLEASITGLLDRLR